MQRWTFKKTLIPKLPGTTNATIISVRRTHTRTSWQNIQTGAAICTPKQFS